MFTAFRRQLAFVLVLLSIVISAGGAWAQTGVGTLAPGSIGPSYGKYVAIAGVAVGAVAGVAIYYAVREPRVTGCVFQSGDALAIQGSGAADPVYLLDGDASTLSAGQRVTVLGKKKKDAANHKTLTVSRVSRNYGACTPPPAAMPARAQAAPVDDLTLTALAVRP